MRLLGRQLQLPPRTATSPPAQRAAAASLLTQNLIGYTGSLTDTFNPGSTGYVHDGARWYSTMTSAWTSQDTSSYLDNPANGNRYAYAADNPTKQHRPHRS